MIELNSVSNPAPAVSPFESATLEAVAPRLTTPGSGGTTTDETSRSETTLAAKGKSRPILSPFESVIGDRDERVRIVDTDLTPWRMICALRMRGPSGTAMGTGWLVGPRTVVTAGHCVFSNHFFGGWASTIEVIPGLNGHGDTARPFDSVTSTSFSSVDRWVNSEEADFDIGCIHLNQDIGNELGWFSIGSLAPAELENFLVNVSGYPADRGRGFEQYHNSNRVSRVSDRRVFYEVDTFGGQSGAPVWIYEDEESSPVVIGIHAYGIGGTPDEFNIEANSAPRIIPEVFNTIRGWVEDDGGWPE